MKNIKTFEEFLNENLNEGIANPRDIKSDARSLTQRKADIEEFEELDAKGLKLLDNQHALLSKTLKTPEKDLMLIDSESNSYELVQAIHIGFQKRRDAGDENIRLVSTLNFQSPFSEQSRPAYHYQIVDQKIDLITLEDGGDYSDFIMVIYPRRQEKALVTWANDNLSSADSEY